MTYLSASIAMFVNTSISHERATTCRVRRPGDYQARLAAPPHVTANPQDLTLASQLCVRWRRSTGTVPPVRLAALNRSRTAAGVSGERCARGASGAGKALSRSLRFAVEAGASKTGRRTGRFPATEPSDTPPEWRKRAADSLNSSPDNILAPHSPANSGEGRWVVLTKRHNDYYDAYSMEVEACMPGAVEVEVGVFETCGHVAVSVLQRMACCRAHVEVLAVARDAPTLVQRIGALQLQVGGREYGGVGFVLTREEVGRHEPAEGARWPSTALYPAIADQLHGWPAPKHLRHAPDHRFAVVETHRGYLFGRVRYAPPPMHEEEDWGRKPSNYAAGLIAELAAVAVNIAVGGRRAAELTLQDPCCGSGTIVYHAWRLGLRASGSDAEPSMLAMTARNLHHFAPLLHKPLPPLQEADACSPDLEATDLIVTNVPFGRTVTLGNTRGGRRPEPRGDTSPAQVDAQATEALRPLLLNLKAKARRHIFFSGSPLAPRLEELGYRNVTEVCVCRFGRRFMSCAIGEGSAVVPQLKYMAPLSYRWFLANPDKNPKKKRYVSKKEPK